MLKLSPAVATYTHHDYLEPELRKMVEEGKTDVLDLTFDADEVAIFNVHSFLKPFLKDASARSKDLIKYFEEDPMFQEGIAPLIIKHHKLSGVKPDQVFVGNGNYSLFKDIIGFLGQKKLMIGNGPQFPEFPSLFTALGGSYKPVFNEATWQFPIKELIAEIEKNKDVSFVFMDIPSNSTGNYASPEEIKPVIKAAQKQGSIVIVDEAYANYLPPHQTAAQLANTFPNLVIIRSLSKAFDLGGLRFGYTIMSKELAKHFKQIHAPFEPSVFSVLAARYVFEHYKELAAHLAKTRKAITTFRKKTLAVLRDIGFKELPSHPFMPQVMLHKKDGNSFRFFLDRKLVVRSGKMYQFTCPLMDDHYVRLRFPLKESTYKQMMKRLRYD